MTRKKTSAPQTDTPTAAPPLARRVLLLGISALILRCLHLAAVSDLPVMLQPVGDGESYHLWAQDLAAGNWLGTELFYAAPFYPYAMGVFYAVFGVKLMALRVAQAVLGSLACVFLYRASARFFDEHTGWITGILAALSPTALYFDALVQKAGMAFFLFSVLLYLTARALSEPSRRLWLGAGALLGLLALTRENAWVFLPVLLLCIGLHNRADRTRAAVWAACLLAGTVAIVFPVTLRNKVVADSWVLTTSNLGTNFYIGNNHEANGRYAPLKWGRGDWKFERADALELARAEAGADLPAEGVSGFWLRKTFGEIAADPLDWLALMGRKTLLLVNRTEIGDTEDLYSYAAASPLLAVAAAIFHFGILFPLALLGVWTSWEGRRTLLPLYLITLAYAGSVVLFFVFDRFRFPLTAPLLMFAAHALVHRARLRRASRRWVPATLVGAGLLLSWWPMVDRAEFEVNAAFNTGKLLARQGDFAGALPYLQKAVAASPNRPQARVSLGNTLMRLGKVDEAETQLKAALSLKPDLGEAQAQLGLLYLVRGRVREAVAAYELALPLLPDDPGARNNLAWLLAAGNDPSVHDGARAVTLAEEALRLAPDHTDYLDTLGVALARAGRFEEAATAGEKAVAAATAAGDAREAAARRTRLAGYRTGTPYQDAP